METIPISDCEKIGFIKKTHGVQGELVLGFEPQFEFAAENASCFFVELEGLLVPFFVVEDGFRFRTDDTAIVTFNGVESEKFAKRLVGCGVYLFKNDIVEEIQGDIDTQLEGYLLIDERLGEIGKIEHIDDYSGNIVLTVDYRGAELLVPFNDDFLVDIDHEKAILKLRLPDGLMD